MDGNFYGTTLQGGSKNEGTVFKITPSGAITTLANFTGANGTNPEAGLTAGSDGNFYGTTYSGGTSNEGAVFQMTPTGTLNALYSFSATDSHGINSDGTVPYAGLVEGSDGNLYGTAAYGGLTASGTVFKIAVTGLGALAGSSLLTTTATVLDLTSEGATDWAHIGRGGFTGFDHKAGVGYLIGNFTVFGTGTVSADTNDLRACSWSDGSPTASVSGDKTVEQITGSGSGFQLTALADTTPRTLTVYVGGADTGGKLLAHLSDGSAPNFVETRAVTAGRYDVAYTLTYHAGSAGQVLYVKWHQSVGTGSVSLAGATLH